MSKKGFKFLLVRDFTYGSIIIFHRVLTGEIKPDSETRFHLLIPICTYTLIYVYIKLSYTHTYTHTPHNLQGRNKEFSPKIN